VAVVVEQTRQVQSEQKDVGQIKEIMADEKKALVTEKLSMKVEIDDLKREKDDAIYEAEMKM